MKTDQGEAYQSSEVGLFSCFWTNSWNIAKIITYMEKSETDYQKQNIINLTSLYIILQTFMFELYVFIGFQKNFGFGLFKPM